MPENGECLSQPPKAQHDILNVQNPKIGYSAYNDIKQRKAEGPENMLFLLR